MGVEPTNDGFANRCLTTWLRDRLLKHHNKKDLFLQEIPAKGIGGLRESILIAEVFNF